MQHNGFIAEGVRVCIFLKHGENENACVVWWMVGHFPPARPIMLVTAYGLPKGITCLFCTYNETIDSHEDTVAGWKGWE